MAEPRTKPDAKINRSRNSDPYIAPLLPANIPPEVQLLLPQQQIFCYAYLASNFNGTEAAIRADYSPQSAMQQASALLSLPKVKTAVRALIAQRAARHAQLAEDVVEEFRRLAFSNMLNYVTVDGRGNALIDLSGLTRAQAACIQEVTSEVIETIDGDPKTGTPDRVVRKTKLKLYGKEKSLELLGRHLGIDFDKDQKSLAELLGGGSGVSKVNIQVVYEPRRPTLPGDVQGESEPQGQEQHTHGDGSHQLPSATAG